MSTLPLTIPEPDRTPAIITHLSPLAGFVVPTLGTVLGPLVAWLMFRDRSAALNDQGKEALNFQLSFWLYSLAAGLLMFVLFSLGLLGGAVGAAGGAPGLSALAVGSFGTFLLLFLPVLLVLSLVPFVFMIVAVVRVSAGQPYRYPLSIRFVR